MNNSTSPWLTFLKEHALNSTQANSASLDITTTTLVSPLTEYRLLSVTGADSYKFLQGQVTCDVEELRHNCSRLGAHCTHQGRMIASFRAFELKSQSIGLSLHAGCLSRLKAALGKYIVFSKAVLADCDNLVAVGIAGPDAESLLKPLFPTMTNSLFAVSSENSNHALCIEANMFECWLTPESAQALWLAAAKTCMTGTQQDWDLLKIRQGISEVREETIEMFIPQMLNLDKLNGISYKKGCYTGQEIVARMTYLGKLKRHTYRASVESLQPPAVGADLYGADSEQSIGNIVMTATIGNNQYECLICAVDQAVAADAVYLAPGQQQKFKTLSLPYAITSAKDDK